MFIVRLVLAGVLSLAAFSESTRAQLGAPTPPAWGIQIPLGEIKPLRPEEGVACGKFFVTPPGQKPGVVPAIGFVMAWAGPKGETVTQEGTAPTGQWRARIDNSVRHPTVLWIYHFDRNRQMVEFALSGEEFRRSPCLKTGLAA